MGNLSDRIKKYDDQIKKKPVQTQSSDRVIIGGRPIDVFSLESFALWRGSDITSYMRKHKLRVLEAAKSTAKRQLRIGAIPMKTFLLIILLVGGVIAGVVMLMFLPDIMNFFRGILGSFGGIMCIMLLFKKKSYIDREMEKTQKIMKRVRKFIGK